MYKNARTFKGAPDNTSFARNARLRGETQSTKEPTTRRKLGQFRDEDTEEVSGK